MYFWDELIVQEYNSIFILSKHEHWTVSDLCTVQGGVIMFGALLLFEDEFIHIVAISFTALIITELTMVALTIRLDLQPGYLIQNTNKFCTFFQLKRCFYNWIFSFFFVTFNSFFLNIVNLTFFLIAGKKWVF